MTFDLTPLNVKDATGATKPMIAYNDGTNSAFARPVLDSSGAIINPATSGNQTTANSALATIATNTAGLATASAQTTGNTSAANTATSTANIDTAIGAKADTAASSDTGTFSLIALFKRLLSRTPALGIALAAASTPVVLASDGTLPLPTGAATAAAQGTGNTSIANVDTNLGAKADTAASSDTGTFSLIALLKRGLQSLTTIGTNTGRIPAQGSAVSSASLPVVIASDQAALPLPTGAATAANQSTGNTKLDTIIANTGAGSVNLTITPTVTAGAYTTGMVAGGKLSLTSAVRASGGSGIIQSVSVSKKTALTAPYDVHFFHTDPTNSTFTDNSALALNVADLPYLIGIAHCSDLVDNGTPKTLQAANVALPFKLATGTTLFAVAVIRGGETLASTSALVINATVIQD